MFAFYLEFLRKKILVLTKVTFWVRSLHWTDKIQTTLLEMSVIRWDWNGKARFPGRQESWLLSKNFWKLHERNTNNSCLHLKLSWLFHFFFQNSLTDIFLIFFNCEKLNKINVYSCDLRKSFRICKPNLIFTLMLHKLILFLVLIGLKLMMLIEADLVISSLY